MKEQILKILDEGKKYGYSNESIAGELLCLYNVIKSVCPNPECKSKNIIHEETYSYCEDCRRMFNGKTVL